MLAMQLLAHAGELHESATTKTLHAWPWFVSLLAFIAITLSLYVALSKLLSSRRTALLCISIYMLVLGFTTYNTSYVVSIVAIVAGLVLTIALAFTGFKETPTAADSKKTAIATKPSSDS